MFKAGLVLEQVISDGLLELGIQHRRTTHLGSEDVNDNLDLIDFCGRKLMRLVQAWLEEQQRLNEELQALQQATRLEHLHTHKSPPFWHNFIQPTVDITRKHL